MWPSADFHNLMPRNGESGQNPIPKFCTTTYIQGKGLIVPLVDVHFDVQLLALVVRIFEEGHIAAQVGDGPGEHIQFNMAL